jgi:hypothetical protein
MSIPIAGRCGALAVLMASSFSCAVAQQAMTCERGPKDWPVRQKGAIVDDISGCCADLADLVKRSPIIVRGEVTDCNGRLSLDKREIWTDYTINIQEIYKQVGKSSFAKGAKIRVTRLGGYFVVDGHPVEYDVGSPPIPQGMPEIFFISTCNSPDCSTAYTFAVGSLGAISLENGQVSCSAKPHPVWKPYCAMTADSLISAVREKVAASIPAGSPNQPSTPKPLPASNAPPVAAAPAKPLKDVYSVEELVANPQNFAHTMVTVRGCFVRNFELEVLEPCGGGLTREKLIWVEDAGTVAMMLRLAHDDELLGGGPEFIPFTPKGGLLFTYNEARDSRAWHKLPRGCSIDGSEVVLFGQFETSSGGFGHLGAYANELILVDVLSNKPATIRPKSR